jgi:hypothetical protein
MVLPSDPMLFMRDEDANSSMNNEEIEFNV